jgi:hypothetical protein
MDNHYYLLIETPDGNLSLGMHFTYVSQIINEQQPI